MSYEEVTSSHNSFKELTSLYDEQINTRVLYGRDAECNDTIYLCAKGTEFEKLNNVEKMTLLTNLYSVVNDPQEPHEKEHSKGVKDVITDFCFWLVDAPTEWGVLCRDVKVHCGFLDAASSDVIVDDVFRILRSLSVRHVKGSKPIRLVLCGHSLGAAIVTVLALHIRHGLSSEELHCLELELITFGGPHVGNSNFARAVRAAVPHIRRYAGRMDIVPKLLSMQCFYEYEHVTPTPMAISEDFIGNVSDACEKWMNSKEEGLVAAGGQIISELTLKAHSLKTYQKIIFNKQSRLRSMLTFGVQAATRLGKKVVTKERCIKTAEAMSKPLLKMIVGGASAGSSLAVSSLAGMPLLITSAVSAGASLVSAGFSIATFVKTKEIQKKLNDVSDNVDVIRTSMSDLLVGQDAIQNLVNEGFTSNEKSLVEIANSLQSNRAILQENHSNVMSYLQLLGIKQDQFHEETLMAIGGLSHELKACFGAMTEIQVETLEEIRGSTLQLYRSILSSRDATLDAIGNLHFSMLWLSFEHSQQSLRGHLHNPRPDAGLMQNDLSSVLGYVDGSLNKYEGEGGFIHLLHCELILIMAVQVLEKFSVMADECVYLEFLNKYHILIGRVNLIRVMQAVYVSEIGPITYALSSLFTKLLKLSPEFAKALAANYAEQTMSSNLEGLYLAFALDPSCAFAHIVRLHSCPWAINTSDSLQLMIRSVPLLPEERVGALKMVLSLPNSIRGELDARIVLDIGVELNSVDLIVIASSYLVKNSFDYVITAVDVADAMFSVMYDLKKFHTCAMDICCLSLESVHICLKEGCDFCNDAHVVELKPALFKAGQELIVILCELGYPTDMYHMFNEISQSLFVTIDTQSANIPLLPAFYSLLEQLHSSSYGFATGRNLATARYLAVPLIIRSIEERWPKCKLEYQPTGNNVVTSLMLESFKGVSQEARSPYDQVLNDIGYLTHLHMLKLVRVNLKSFPLAFKSLSVLQNLILDDNDLNDFPESVTMLSSLKNLSIQRNNIHTLPITVGNLVNLVNMNLSGNIIENFPEDVVRGLSNLACVIVKGNKLSEEARTRLRGASICEWYF